jgi:mannose-1-phosphate guanylyltransferase
MEKASGLAVVPGDFGWNDVGSWQSAWELAARDGAGNALSPGSIGIDAKNNLVRSLSAGNKAIAVVGVDDLVVVDTDDAVLVIPRERAQDVRLVVDALKKAGRSDLL